MTQLRIVYLTCIFCLVAGAAAYAGPTRVGNGDDGADLEGANPIEQGPVIEARQRAVEILKQVNAPGLPGLGMLLPEVETGPLFEAKKDVTATLPEDQGAFHADMRGQVYARTFAEPHAATRIFPAAQKLDQDQLAALLIHEGLHRSLPPSIRENEQAVAAITLSLTSPNATFDQAQATIRKYLHDEATYTTSHGTVHETTLMPVGSETMTYPIPENARIKQPSLIGYSYTHFNQPSIPGRYPISSMHELKSYLYPFGGDRHPFGLGIDASMINYDGSTNSGAQSGPLGLSGRLRLWSIRGFDVSIWGSASLNMLSADELKHSPFGRDVETLGISMRKDTDRFYVENFLSYSFPGSSDRQIGLVDYTYSYGNVIDVATHMGALFGKLHVGGYAEIYLADYFRESDGYIFHLDTGRYRLFAAGPEVTWQEKDFAVTLRGRFLVDATQDATFDTLGDIMGAGAGQGSISGSVSVFF